MAVGMRGATWRGDELRFARLWVVMGTGVAVWAARRDRPGPWM